METSPSSQRVRPLRAQLFGPARFWLGEGELPAAVWARRAERSLCLLLLATPGHAMTRERIAARLWPEASPAAARNALSKALHALRRVLEPGLATGDASAYLTSDRDTIGFRQDCPLIVDLDRFESLVATAARQAPDQQRASLREALALYRDDLLADELYRDWPTGRRESLRQARTRAALELAELALAAASPREALGPLEAFAAADPTNEAAQLRLMQLYVACGQPERAMRQYRRCQEALRTELDAVPGPALAEYAAMVQGQRTPSTAMRPAPLALPPVPQPPTPLVGRGREIEAAHDLLTDPAIRLVTLTGPAGVGKTRLAKEIALTTDAFPGGVLFLPLADIRAPELVVVAVARAVGGANESPDHLAAVQQAIGDRQVLLVLDNFEQILPAAADFASLLDRCPRLKLLVTSRSPLHLAREEIMAVAPLPLPPATDRLTQRTLRRYPAATLFLDRLQAARPDFAPSDEAAPLISAICRRLEGLPLALELAAARGRHLSPNALLARLEHRLDLLTGGPRDVPNHQRTLRSTLAWSYDALTPTEQTLFRRLAIFAGGFTVGGAAWIMGSPSPPNSPCLPPKPSSAGGRSLPTLGEGGFSLPSPSIGRGSARSAGVRAVCPEDVRGMLTALVDANLLQVESSGEASRYRMLETMRDFGLEQLADRREDEMARTSHAAYMLTLAEQLNVQEAGPDQVDALDRWEQEDDNLRAALTWLTDRGEHAAALGLANGVRYYWELRGGLTEGVWWFTKILAQTSGQLSEERARALYTCGTFAEQLGDLERAQARIEEALTAWRALDNQRQVGMALNFLGQIAISRGQLQRAREMLTETVETLRALGQPLDVAVALVGLGNAEIYLHDYAAAEAHYEEGVALFRGEDDAGHLAMALSNFGALEFWQGKLARAADCYEESLALSRKVGHRRGIADILVNFGDLYAARGDLAQAARSCQEGLQIYRELGHQWSEAVALLTLADITHRQGDDDLALSHVQAALAYFVTAGDEGSVFECIELAARLRPFCLDPNHSIRLLGAAAARRAQSGIPRQAPNEASYDTFLDSLKAELTPAVFATAWQAGQRLTLDEAVSEVLPESEPSAASPGTEVPG